MDLLLLGLSSQIIFLSENSNEHVKKPSFATYIATSSHSDFKICEISVTARSVDYLVQVGLL